MGGPTAPVEQAARDQPHRWNKRRGTNGTGGTSGTSPTCGRSRVLPIRPASKKLYRCSRNSQNNFEAFDSTQKPLKSIQIFIRTHEDTTQSTQKASQMDLKPTEQLFLTFRDTVRPRRDERHRGDQTRRDERRRGVQTCETQVISLKALISIV